ncbi:HIT family protein [Sulfitobacter sp. AS59]|uniref:HIT family protein n=1 Tax=Sulfitobacter sp. AS59 TaxID=3135784 RepID=UPI003180AE15
MTCIFCSIIAGQAPGHVLFRGQRVIGFLSLEGHPLVVPLKHITSLKDLDDETGAEVFQSARRVASELQAVTGCDGVNLLLSDGPAAGQDVFHLHLHVKPRWHGDDVRLIWDTATASDNERKSLADELRARLSEV